MKPEDRKTEPRKPTFTIETIYVQYCIALDEARSTETAIKFSALYFTVVSSLHCARQLVAKRRPYIRYSTQENMLRLGLNVVEST